MSQTSPTPNQRVVTELKVSAHLMLLDPGVFCIFHSPGTQPPDPATGLPGVRVTRPPATPAELMAISTFNPDGWLGGDNNAALVRVNKSPSQVLVTIYQAAGSAQEAPKLQVLRLSDQSSAASAPTGVQAVAQAGTQRPPSEAQAPGAPVQGAQARSASAQQDVAAAEKPEVAAHVQRHGDLLTRLGDWMGERGSQNWIEGFAVLPSRFVEPADLEYQAVLGKGWLSPWAEGGKYCGSRGMALPILGLRVRLKGDAAAKFDVRLQATFIDGTAIGPVDGSQTAEAPSLAPLEAFKIEFVPRGEAETGAAPAAHPAASAPASKAAKLAPKLAPKPGKLPPAKPAATLSRGSARPVARGTKPGTHPSSKPTAKTPIKTGGRR